MPLGMEVGLGSGDFVLDGDPVPPRKRAQPHPIFGPCLLWPNCWMDQGAIWYEGKPQPRQPCVRWGPSSPLKVFGPCLLWPSGWMYEDVTCYGRRSRPIRPHCVRRGPAAPVKGAQQPPLFGTCLLWPRSPISATAKLL